MLGLLVAGGGGSWWKSPFNKKWRFWKCCKGVFRCYMPQKTAGKTGGWGSEIKGWDTYKGGIDFKGGDHTPLHTMPAINNRIPTFTLR